MHHFLSHDIRFAQVCEARAFRPATFSVAGTLEILSSKRIISALLLGMFLSPRQQTALFAKNPENLEVALVEDIRQGAKILAGGTLK